MLGDKGGLQLWPAVGSTEWLPLKLVTLREAVAFDALILPLLLDPGTPNFQALTQEK